jgi:hypothetical protein
MDSNLQQEFSAYLLPNEELLWVEKPVQGFRTQMEDWYLVTNFVIWCCFILVLFRKSGIEEIIHVIQLSLILSILYQLIFRYYYDLLKRKNSVYGISNQRILIKSGILNSEVTTLDIKNLPPVSLIHFKENKGSIKFGEDVSTGIGKSIRVHYAPKFDTIEEVSSVYQLILKLR